MIPKVELERGFIHFGKGLPHMICIPIGGDKMQLVARVGLEEITAVTPLTAANARAKRGMHRYNYAPDIRPQDAVVLSITNGDGDCEMLLCPDKRIRDILQSAVNKK